MSQVFNDDGSKRRWLSRVVVTARLSYAHLAAILGAFSLVTVLSHITESQIRGFLSGLIDSWNQVIRPPTEWLLWHLLTAPLHEVSGVTVVCPLWIRDYLSTGAILVLSYARSAIWDAIGELGSEIRHMRRFSYRYARLGRAGGVVLLVFRRTVSLLGLACVLVVLWPLVLAVLIIIYSIRDDEPILVQSSRERRAFLLSLAPLGYFLLFAVINLLSSWIF